MVVSIKCNFKLIKMYDMSFVHKYNCYGISRIKYLEHVAIRYIKKMQKQLKSEIPGKA